MSNEVRDRLAGLEGWTWTGKRWEKGSMVRVECPIPDDLTTCAAMWDKYAGATNTGRWEWSCSAWTLMAVSDAISGHTRREVRRSGHDAASELRDRWALLGEVLKARGVW